MLKNPLLTELLGLLAAKLLTKKRRAAVAYLTVAVPGLNGLPWLNCGWREQAFHRGMRAYLERTTPPTSAESCYPAAADSGKRVASTEDCRNTLPR